MFKHILVVCEGNICRSPMGAALLSHKLGHLPERTMDIQSAGLHALVGYPADLMAQKLMAKEGIDISSHRARQLERSHLLWADLILVMDKQQKNAVFSFDLSARGKVYLLGEWSDFEVPDPYQRPRKIFEIAFGCISKGVDDWVLKLMGDP